MTTTEHTSTKQDILQYLLKRGQGTAVELAETLSITPQAIRRHLKDLELENLIEYETVQQGMGRPQHIYRLSRTGRDRFPNRYSEFAVSFLDTLAETAGEEQVKAVLRKQWERKAAYYRDRLGKGGLTHRLANLVKLRQEEGYMAEWFPVEANGSRAAEKYILYEHNCAISEVAESYPSVCGHELEMFAAVLPDCQVERTQWLNEGEHHCGYLIQANPSK
ncbi:iron-sulfur cluster biosynthesis transcriptional regulator SufR [Oscillatoria salina]|uniref:iron-sulfur cluster biosynthesis transcriptional regulator SufR n=1 Tax=Oscillatoria salina TaxID=331517 RepID=UPI001CCE522F|nr:iron-sulfur cluster biosynthesis transcriptional regulator SufR [Oscillatoria salina]MBZ8183214.1 iron-sulfur cluster biosynthesis transcriptional regulator SufR [Oscillatoria salina IIICB1]